MKPKDLKRLAVTLNGNDSAHKYYVYMLMAEGEDKPFYIGKGEGTRVFQHELEAKTEQERWEILRPGEEMDSSAEVSEKVKKILETLKSGRVKKIIVKWGLTEQEAFMCESALFNMYEYLHPGTLTNIDNCHASKAEKEAPEHTTKARDAETFLSEVALEPVSFRQTMQKSGIDLGRDEIRFFKIGNELQKKVSEGMEPNDDVIYACTRTAWKMARKPKYAVGLDGTVLKGAYVVKEWSKVQVGSEWRKEFVKKEAAELQPEEKQVLDTLLSMKNCLMTDEYLNGQWDAYYSKSKVENWERHEIKQ